MNYFKSILIFIIAGLCEIGGGYLIWQYFRGDRPLWIGLLGILALMIYGWVVTLQIESFARVYATYGGFFIVLSILWAMKFDQFKPDKFDVIGAAVVLVGVGIMYFSPRGGYNP